MRIFQVVTLLHKVFLCISGIILTHFETVIVLQTSIRNQVAVCFGPTYSQWPCTSGIGRVLQYSIKSSAEYSSHEESRDAPAPSAPPVYCQCQRSLQSNLIIIIVNFIRSWQTQLDNRKR